MFYILQEDNHSCGIACLKTMLATLNHDSNYLYLPNPKESGERYSFYDLMEFAYTYGFTLSAYTVQDKNCFSLDDGLPMMVSTNRDDIQHLYLVYKVNDRYVYYFDPAFGKKKVKKADFLAKWDGKVLKLDNFVKKACPVKRQPLLTKMEELVMDVLEIAACVCLTLGLWFVSDKYPFYLPIMMFASFAILEIMLRVYCIMVFKRIDERTYTDSLKVKKGKMKEFYLTVENNKRYEVTMNLNAIYAVMSIVVVSLMIMINGGYSLYYLLFGVLFAGFEVVFLNPYLNKKNQEICEMENNVSDDDLGLIKLIHEKAYRYAKITLLYRYVTLGFTLLGIVLIMALSEVISIPYIIFYLCINIFFYKSMVMGLSMDQNIKKHRQNIVHQINLIDKA